MTTWANDLDRFWNAVECDGLFLLFDTSAHLNGGWPGVDSDDVLAHAQECGTCQENDVRVSVLTDGTEVLED
jgi:hypothetical protein